MKHLLAPVTLSLLVLIAAPAAAQTDTTPPEPIVLIGPADGATIHARSQDPPPVLQWQSPVDAGSGIASLRLHVDDAVHDLEPTSTSSSERGPAMHWPNPLPIAPGTHTWRLEAADGEGNVRESGTRSFTFVIDDVPPQPFALLGPPEDVLHTTARPTFTWEVPTDAASGVVRQELVVDGLGVIARLGPTASTFTAQEDVYNYEWEVRAYDAAGNVRVAGPRAFHTDVWPPSAGLQVAGSPALTGQPVEFTTHMFDNSAISRVEWDFDGDGTFETEGNFERRVTRIYETPGKRTVRLRLTDPAGWTATAEAVVEVFLGPPAGIGGVSINDGARFTNRPHVLVSVVWPPFATGILLSNDGGFFGAQPRHLAPEIPWTLDSSGAERLPKTIYVRFPGVGNVTYQDDIILDETAPRIAFASARRTGRHHRVALRAADATSGLASLQLARDRTRPGGIRAFRRTLRVKARPRWVRVTDHAGNRSGWRRIAARR